MRGCSCLVRVFPSGRAGSRALRWNRLVPGRAVAWPSRRCLQASPRFERPAHRALAHHGEQAFFGMEMDVDGGLETFEQARPLGGSWKARCAFFRRSTPTFSAPFNGSEISHVDNPNKVAYCRCRLRTDLLDARPGRGVYIEVDVRSNVDNLSLAIVDFEGGGHSSVTFSPEAGRVLREEIREAPRAIEGTLSHRLLPASLGRRFEGTMGLYLRGGHISFFRRSRVTVAPPAGTDATVGGTAEGPWETTVFAQT
ncbi:unnamed protein product [Polarella glacialis]|uniref:Uncharacterized protein n=1 Tax=Polarella glacialis TaxID=89957 RepID=A0A813E2N4_POLGL|nr:unnamed protein product [Polarella glacialis]CAE8609548.1 unnamed protein product [Polarella glacialis]